MPVRDDLGTPVDLGRVRRIVSLDPSLTETVAYVDPQLVVGRTDACTHPPGIAATSVGVPQIPDHDAIADLRPDVVLAASEKTDPGHVTALRERGIPVYVVSPTTVAGALDSVERLLGALGLERSAWIDVARAELARPVPALTGVRTACFISRRPWTVLGRDTFAGDLLRCLGLRNVFAEHAERYPRIDPAAARRDADLVVLPDEPYRFTPSDGPEAFAGRRCAIVSGRHLAGYGPSLVEARAVLGAALTAPVRAV